MSKKKGKKRQQKKQLLQQQQASSGLAPGADAADEEGDDEDEDEREDAPASPATSTAASAETSSAALSSSAPVSPAPVSSAPVAPASATPTAPSSAAPASSPEVVGAPVVALAPGEEKKPEDATGPVSWPRTLAQFLDEQLKLTPGYCYALICAVVFCVYANSMRVPYLFDDAPVITRNRLFHELSFDNAAKIVGNHPLRAIPNLTFYLNYHIQGTPAYQYADGEWRGTYGPNWTYHLFNMAVHAANGILLFLLLQSLLAGEAKPALRATATRRLAQKKAEALPSDEETTSSLSEWIALGATLFWLVHPIQTMAVTYITQRYALFAAFGTFGALLCYVRLRRRMEAGTAWIQQSFWSSIGLYLGVWGFTVIGCLSKENAAIVIWLLPVIELFCFSRAHPESASPPLLVEILGDFWARMALSLSLTPAFFAALLYHYHATGTLEDIIPASAPTFPDHMSYFRTEWVVTLKYLRLFVLPTDLTVEQAFPCLVWSDPVHVAEMLKALLGHGLIVSLGALWYFTGRKFLALCVVWYYATLAIESSFFPILDPMVEHRMYIPSAFLAAAVVYVLARGAANVWLYGPDWTRMFAKRVAGSLAGMEETVRGWLEPIRLGVFESRHEVAIGIVGAWGLVIVLFGIGTHIRNNSWGDKDDSMRIWRDTIEKRPDCARAYSSLGMEMLYNGRWVDAVEPIEAALSLGPYHVEGWNNIGKAYLELGSMMPNHGLNPDPKKSSLYPNPLLSWAEETLKRGIEVNEVAPSPSVPLCWNNLGLTYLKMAERVPADHKAEKLKLEGDASRALAMAVKIDPGYDTAWINLGTSYVRQCEKTDPGHEQRRLALEAVKALKGSGATRSPYHQLFQIAALNLALADRYAKHHAEAFYYLDLLFRRAMEDGATDQVLAVIGMYAEEGREMCDELFLLPDPLARQKEELKIAQDPSARKELQESIDDIETELSLARKIQQSGKLLQAAEVFAAEADKVKQDPKAFAKYARAAGKLAWYGNADPARAFKLFDLAIGALPADSPERRDIEREKSVLQNLPGPPK